MNCALAEKDCITGPSCWHECAGDAASARVDNAPAEAKKGALGVKTRLRSVRLAGFAFLLRFNLLDSSGVRISGHCVAS